MNNSAYRVRRLLLAAGVAAGLAVASSGLAQPLAAAGTLGAASVGAAHHDAARPLKAKAARKARRTAAIRHRRRYARAHTAPIVRADAQDQAAQPRSSDDNTSPMNNVARGTVHYDHGPAGLSDDVSTFGISKKF